MRQRLAPPRGSSSGDGRLVYTYPMNAGIPTYMHLHTSVHTRVHTGVCSAFSQACPYTCPHTCLCVQPLLSVTANFPPYLVSGTIYRHRRRHVNRGYRCGSLPAVHGTLPNAFVCRMYLRMGYATAAAADKSRHRRSFYPGQGRSAWLFVLAKACRRRTPKARIGRSVAPSEISCCLSVRALMLACSENVWRRAPL